VTNTPQSEVPSSFVFTVYLTPIGRVDIFERIVVRGTTTGCADLQHQKWTRPAFEGIASVADVRLGKTYRITNGEWLGAETKERRLNQKNK
jgi:hypothetical protein